MVDIVKQIVFWRDSAKEDWAVARQLVDNDHIRHGLFFAHLTLEKTLKALICKHMIWSSKNGHSVKLLLPT
jgi:HEPN domain-containing protein